jgi:hypothetical protein
MRWSSHRVQGPPAPADTMRSPLQLAEEFNVAVVITNQVLPFLTSNQALLVTG